jgi:hypothetical protein
MKIKQRQSLITFRYFLKIFLIVTFPLHIWALLMIFRDFESVSERTVLWDGIGYAGYSLIFTLVESLGIALVVWLLSLLLPRDWENQRAINIAGSLYMILAGASIVDMAFHAFSEARISRQYLHGLETYPSLTNSLIAGAILLFSALIIMLVLRSKKIEHLLTEFYDRIMLLSYLYLALDVMGIALVIVRNISAQV